MPAFNWCINHLKRLKWCEFTFELNPYIQATNKYYYTVQRFAFDALTHELETTDKKYGCVLS